MSHSRWNLLPAIPDNHSIAVSGFTPLLAQLLYNRGITEPSHLELFIAADDRLSGDPLLMPGMHQAVARVYQALLGGESIAVYGDFDTDGITATALLVQGLSMLNANVVPYIPHRMTEGYGLKTAALEKLHRQGVSLVVTVDCGITGLREVKRAKRIGLDIVITDHHTPPEILPPAAAVVNPKLAGSAYPFSDLAGVGVAFKLLQALFRGVGKEERLDELADLVALGTVADVVPLLDENRYLVNRGLKRLGASPRLGIREIVAQVGMSAGTIDSTGISWIIAPRLNAAGRLEHAMSSYRLLTTDSREEAQQLAAWLEKKNTERQRLTVRALAIAREQVLAQEISPILIVSHRDFPVGICGLVASRIAEEFYRPAVVIRTGEQMSSASCRSIPEFNMIHALNQYHSLFTHVGGHAQAAGFTMPTGNLPRLREALLQLAATQLEGVDLRPRLDIDAEVRLADVGGDAFLMMQKLAPFGRGNPVPVFLSRRVEVVDCRTMGESGEHLRLKLRQDGTLWDAVAFRLGTYYGECSSPLDVVYSLEIDRWGGEEIIRLNILDFTPAAG